MKLKVASSAQSADQIMRVSVSLTILTLTGYLKLSLKT